MKHLITIPLLVMVFIGLGQESTTKNNAMETTASNPVKTVAPRNQPIVCKLTTPAMQNRKETILASIKKQVIQKSELPNGYAYQFKGTDAIIDELLVFIKTERLCCDFFDFNLSIAGDGLSAWLSITGPKEAKAFITDELKL